VGTPHERRASTGNRNREQGVDLCMITLEDLWYGNRIDMQTSTSHI